MWRLPSQPNSEEVVEENTFEDKSCGNNPFELFKHLQIWGIIIVTSAMLILFIALIFHRSPRPQIITPPHKKIVMPVTNVVAQVAVITNVPPPVVFPKMRLQGLVCNGDRSTATIDKRVVGVGERIGEVEIVEIGTNSVTIELQGQQKVLYLGEDSWWPDWLRLGKKSHPAGKSGK